MFAQLYIRRQEGGKASGPPFFHDVLPTTYIRIVDTDKLAADIYESRRLSSRPPVDQ